jgi:hypothetical protein
MYPYQGWARGYKGRLPNDAYTGENCACAATGLTLIVRAVLGTRASRPQ